MSNLIIGTAVAIIGTIATTVGMKIHKKHHYDENGYNGYGYDKDGFDKDGFAKDGFNKDGFDKNGFAKDGFNKYGFDKDGFDKNGFNDKGIDKDGYDKEGYNRAGFNSYGVDREGYDKMGYKDGFNRQGIDQSGFSKKDYQNKIKEMQEKLTEAHTQMNQKKFEYALHQIRIGLEIGVKCVICHLKGSKYIKDKLDSNITFCKYEDLLEEDFIEKLYGAKNHCNDMQHDNNIEKTYNQVYFAYKTLEELMNKIQEFIQ